MATDPSGAPGEGAPHTLLGDSPAMRRVRDLIARVAPTDTTVLLMGETGTGKELAAAAIHEASPRRAARFVAQNCSALADSLLESELFGHLRGSFTGATWTKPGLFDLADGGTLFLDEVGDMSPALQAKLLRVLQEGHFVPVGGTLPRHADVRVVSATHQPLEELVARGLFRNDLYYRLHVFTIELPPLRERREDIPLLARHFLARACVADGLAPKTLAPEALAALRAYPWPGNVRELESELRRAVVLARGEPQVGLCHLSDQLLRALPERPALRGRRIDGTLAAALEALERQLLAEGLERNHWNKSLAARELGISRANLVAKVKRYGLHAPAADGRAALGHARNP
mgnify:CR=1 FL=1